MMKNFYNLQRNGIQIAESEDLDHIKEVAQQDADMPLIWKDNSDEDGFYCFAFGLPNRTNGRDEYEVTVVRKRV